MAYMNQEIKAKIVAVVSPILKKHGLKGSFKIDHYTGLTLSINSGGVDFGPLDKSLRGRELTEKKWVSEEVRLKAIKILDELRNAMRLPSYYDKTNAQIDYFDTAYYYDVNVGRWDKGYILTA